MPRFALLLVTVLALAAAPAARAQDFEIGHIPQCTEAVPAAASLPDAAPIPVTVLLLLDGVPADRVGALEEKVRTSYGPLGLDVRFIHQPVAFDTEEADELIEKAKALFGGKRPPYAHLVYTVTSKDIRLDGQTAVAGLADCIGGVAFDENAFAVGEDNGDDAPIGSPPFAFMGFGPAKIAAHELGHLFGAHHHYANCAEGVSSEQGEEISPCTLMFNDVSLVSLNFSSLNGGVVRGHAEAYVKPLTAAPPGATTATPQSPPQPQAPPAQQSAPPPSKPVSACTRAKRRTAAARTAWRKAKTKKGRARRKAMYQRALRGQRRACRS